MAYNTSNQQAQFVLILNAHISHGVFPSTSNVCVKMDVAYGPDWLILAGQRQAVSATSVSSETGHRFVFDLPYHVTFSSTNPFRWPQLIISCYGTDFLGHDIPQGYGCVRVPTTPGSHTREVACFTPEPSSMFQSLVGFLWGRRPEFVEPSIVASADGRHLTRVATKGKITISMDVILKDTKRYGFDVHSSTLSLPSEMKLPNYEIRGFNEASPPSEKPETSIAERRQIPPPLERSNTRIIDDAIDAIRKEIQEVDETAEQATSQPVERLSTVPESPTSSSEHQQTSPSRPTASNIPPVLAPIQAIPRRTKPRPLPALADD